MSVVDTFFWWSGAIAWLVLAQIGLIEVGDYVIDWLVKSFFVKTEFLAFVADRLKAKRP